MTVQRREGQRPTLPCRLTAGRDTGGRREGRGEWQGRVGVGGGRPEGRDPGDAAVVGCRVPVRTRTHKPTRNAHMHMHAHERIRRHPGTRTRVHARTWLGLEFRTRFAIESVEWGWDARVGCDRSAVDPVLTDGVGLYIVHDKLAHGHHFVSEGENWPLLAI